LCDGKVTANELKEFFDQLYKSEYWIPTYPTEFRSGWGIVLSGICILWCLLFAILGGTHKTLSVFGLSCVAGTLILGWIFCKIVGGLISGALEDAWMLAREKDFLKICDEWNESHKDKPYTITPGRYGSYIIIEFKVAMKNMGKFLMQAKKVKDMIKIKAAVAKKRVQADHAIEGRPSIIDEVPQI
jgi:hypothetical protein